MKKIISIILIMLSIGIFNGCESKGNLSMGKYLNLNKSYINLNSLDDFKDLNIVKDDLKNKKIILTGEMHGFDKDKILKMKMVKYLQKEIGIKYYLAEMGYSNAYFINRYLETGNEDILQEAFSHTKGTAGCNEVDYNFFKQLYQFNKTLNDKDKIIIVGIDIEHNPMSAYNYIKEVTNSSESELNSIRLLLNSLENYNRQNETEDLYLRADELIKDIQSNETFYKDLLGEEYAGLKIVLDNIKTTCDAYKDDMKFDEIRENQIYKNFMLLDSNIKDGKYYGQWGLVHIYQEKTNFNSQNIDFFASKLNKNNKFKDKIMSIAYIYDKKSLRYIPGNYYINKKIFSEEIDKKDECVLFKLNGKNAPFEKELISPFLSDDEFDKSKVTTDYFQYIVSFKNVKRSKVISN